MVIKLMISKTLKVLVKWPGDLFLLFTSHIGTISLLTRTAFLLDIKQKLNLISK